MRYESSIPFVYLSQDDAHAIVSAKKVLLISHFFPNVLELEAVERRAKDSVTAWHECMRA